MKKLMLITAMTIGLAFSSHAQSTALIEATTKDGRPVILKSDGTWKFATAEKPAVKRLGVTAAGFAAVTNGMTYPEVVAILGREGEIAVDQKSGEYHTIIYRWKGDRGTLGANMSATFQNEKLVSKAQIGLK